MKKVFSPSLPILFKPVLIKATLSGEKTETRRTKGLEFININPDNWVVHEVKIGPEKNKFRLMVTFRDWRNDQTFDVICPFGCNGHYLWVKEAWHYGYDYDNGGTDETEVYYRVDHPAYAPQPHQWKSPMFMPKKVARLFLEIQEINLERLQAITPDAIEREGAREWAHQKGIENGQGKFCCLPHTWEALWIEINGQASWNTNPWVWVIKYKLKIQEP